MLSRVIAQSRGLALRAAASPSFLFSLLLSTPSVRAIVSRSTCTSNVNTIPPISTASAAEPDLATWLCSAFAVFRAPPFDPKQRGAAVIPDLWSTNLDLSRCGRPRSNRASSRWPYAEVHRGAVFVDAAPHWVDSAGQSLYGGRLVNDPPPSSRASCGVGQTSCRFCFGRGKCCSWGACADSLSPLQPFEESAFIFRPPFVFGSLGN